MFLPFTSNHRDYNQLLKLMPLDSEYKKKIFLCRLNKVSNKVYNKLLIKSFDDIDPILLDIFEIDKKFNSNLALSNIKCKKEIDIYKTYDFLMVLSKKINFEYTKIDVTWFFKKLVNLLLVRKFMENDWIPVTKKLRKLSLTKFYINKLEVKEYLKQEEIVLFESDSHEVQDYVRSLVLNDILFDN